MDIKKWIPRRLQLRSAWMDTTFNYEAEIPYPERRKSWEKQRHMKLILFRFKWGHDVYHLVVNREDKLELEHKGSKNGRLW